MAKRKQEEEGGGSWMDTYGDLVTLLMTFFIALYSMSSMVEEKWESLVVAFSNSGGEEVDQIVFTNDPDQEGDGLINNNAEGNGDTLGLIDTNQEEPGSILNSNAIDELYTSLQAYIEENDMSNSILLMQSDDMEKEAGGESSETEPSDPSQSGEASGDVTNNIYIQFTNNVLFEPDSAVLTPDSTEVLQFLGDCLKSVEDDIAMVIVKGHTAISPNSVVDSRLLSSERAGTISNYFENHCGIPSTLLVPLGLAGDYPIASNDTEEGREKNRRVEIVIISKQSQLGQNSELLNALGASFGSGTGDIDAIVSGD